MEWPKKHVIWIKNRVLYMSIPFTWCLPDARAELMQMAYDWDSAVVGGPAVYLMPEYLSDLPYVEIKESFPGALQKVNPLATKTTTGCVRKCKFCAVPAMEGGLTELNDWPDLPIICDNNLLAASEKHLDKVFDRLEKHEWCDFNQGIDMRLLNEYHAERISKTKAMIRFSLDSQKHESIWDKSYELLRKFKVPKSRIRSYALIGFNSGPDEAWKRCKWVESHKIAVLPMWYHSLDQLEKNSVTEHQKNLGWNDYERRKIMQWYYQHKKAVA